MSLLSRIRNVFRRDRLHAEIDEELQSHIEEAIASGRDPEQARRAFGSMLRKREDCEDVKIAAWLESLRSDAAFGFRQLRKHKIVSAAAILSLGLAIGACTSAFRLIDAMLLRPLPVANPDGLYYLEFTLHDRLGKAFQADSFDYPGFRMLRQAVRDDAELFAINRTGRIDITYSSDHEMEKAYRQYVSGWTFSAFGLQPAHGRLFTASDDEKPGAHPVVVLSHDYWMNRFGGDPNVLGRTLRIGLQPYEIVGVAQEGFTGTETGSITDIFVPTMMNPKAIDNPNWGWFRTWVRVRPGVSPQVVREKLQAAMKQYRYERQQQRPSQGPKHMIEQYINAPLSLEPAVAGASGMQKEYKRPLGILAVVVALVLLIACVNVANLMTAQAATRAKEMALRVSIGAGRLRLLQLVLVESLLIAAAASVLGGLFAAWSAPFVVGMINPPDQPARLILPADWRVLTFAAVLAVLVAAMFGLGPALRASAVKPMEALRGSAEHPHSRRRLMRTLTALQMAFCILVLFITGLFLSTFDRLSSQPTGFHSDGLLVLETGSHEPVPYTVWEQTGEHLRRVAGVESAGLSAWPLMEGSAWTGEIIQNGQPRHDGPEPYFLAVAPRWIETMKIEMIDGRDFREDDVRPGAAIVNESFARQYFNGENPVGRSFETLQGKQLIPVRIVGYVRDTRYRDMREPMRPIAFVPYQSRNQEGKIETSNWGTFLVRTSANGPSGATLASILRREVPKARPELRVTNITTQSEVVRAHLIRERLLALLSGFFAIVALILAGVGLFGVIHYAMLQRRREIGIRMALGARSSDVARRVTAESFVMLSLGAIAGLAAGVASAKYIEPLLFGVRTSDPAMILVPASVLIATALAAALPPVLQAVRIDPSQSLRTE